jgi:hypothetical protein
MPNGTRTEYEEGIDKNQNFVNGIDGISTANGDGGVNSIDPLKLIRDPFNNCSPVYPWNFVRTNTIFGVAHAAGLYTAWSPVRAMARMSMIFTVPKSTPLSSAFPG